MSCAICHVRKPRRYCPGVHGEICTLCCGDQREVTVDCPLDCEYLQEAHKHEHSTPANPDQFPNQDIRVREDFLEEHEVLLAATARCVLRAALETPGAADNDVRDALDALIRTYRTLQSGVYYETRPVNALAAQICDGFQAGMEEFRRHEREEAGMVRTRDVDVLVVLAFLERLELDRHNGRPRGRAFLDFLRGFFGATDDIPLTPHTSSLILP